MASIEFIEECKNSAYHNRLGKIILTDTETEITQNDNLKNFTIDDGCYIDGNIIGSIYIRKLTGEFIAVPDDVELVDKSIEAQIGVKYDNAGVEYIKMGKYMIERPNDLKTENKCQITAYDDLSTNIDSKYVCGIDYSEGDKTLSDLYIDVCSQLGLTPKSAEFLNSTIPITANPFTNEEKNRLVLQTIAKIACSFVSIDTETNEIDLCWLSENEEPDYTFTKKDYSSLEGGKIQYGPINSVTIKNSQIDDENVTQQDSESIETNGEHSIIIDEDYILYNAELRQQAITTIFNRLNGLKYIDSKIVSYYGKPFLKIGAKIRIYVTDTDFIDTYVLKHNFTYDGTFESTIESPALTEQEIKTKQDVSLGQFLRDTQITVDKQKGEIEALTKKVEPLNQRLNDLADSIDLFSTDLDSYVLLIPSDENNVPLEAKDYVFNHYSYFKGKQVQVVPKSLTNIEGITIFTTQQNITVSIDTTTPIESLSTGLEFQFDYLDGEDNYSIIKKISVSLTLKGDDGEPGKQGEIGPKGDDGASSYFHVKYSANSDGESMTDVPAEDTEYMGVASTTSPTPPTSPSAYTWSKIKGEKGANGTPGQPGLDGKTPYLHIKYSEDGQNFTPADEDLGYGLGEKPSAWYGNYVDFIEEDSTDFEAYKWYKFTESIDDTLDSLQEQINDNSADLENNYSDLLRALSEKADVSKIDDIITQVRQMQTDTYTKTEIQQIVNGTGVDGTTVTAVVSTEGTFDKDGMHYSRSDKDTTTTINYKGLDVEDKNNNELLFAGVEDGTDNSIVRTDNLTVKTYLRVANNCGRIEEYEDEDNNVGVGLFLI